MIYDHHSGTLRARKTELISILLILAISPLAGCVPLRSPGSSVATDAAQPSATAVAAPSAIPIVFEAEADAQVDESKPGTNYGNSTYLQVDDVRDPSIESFIRFTVTGLSGTIQTARLRVFDTTNPSNNGPAVYATDPSWSETGITWETRPGRLSEALDNKENIEPDSWAEYDVSAWVKSNGTFSFVLAADSNDGATFSSRQGNHPPQLAITLAEGLPPAPETATVTPVSSTPTEMSTATTAPTETSTATLTPTNTTGAGDVVLVGAGDISTCDNDNDELTAQLLDAIPGTVFTTGDNAYEDGTSSEFANCYDPTWGRHKARTQPVPGNHEYHTSNAAGYFQYFDNIPPYYAYDLGTWRIYALNSEIDVAADSPQVSWLQADLAAHPSQCVLAYWHQPRWSSGSHHGSGAAFQTLWRILYQAGVEVVLNGHEHNYERFVPMNALGQPDPLGLREIVVGTGGRNHYDFGTILPTSEVRDDTSYGVLKLTLHAGGYDWQFIPAQGGSFIDSGSDKCH